MLLCQRKKWSIQVNTHEQPELTGHSPTISMWTCRNHFSDGKKTPRGALWRWTLACWHLRQAWAQSVITRRILGQKKRAVISFTEAATPGCVSECKVSNTEPWCCLGTRRLGITVAVSQRKVPSETGSGSCESLQQEYLSEVKPNKSNAGWFCAMAVKSIKIGIEIEQIGLMSGGGMPQNNKRKCHSGKILWTSKKVSTWANQRIASSAKGGNEPKLMMLDKNSKTTQ